MSISIVPINRITFASIKLNGYFKEKMCEASLLVRHFPETRFFKTNTHHLTGAIPASLSCYEDPQQNVFHA